jgi:hypothetical protein
MAEMENPVPGLPVEPGTVPTKGNGSVLICTKDPQGFTITLDVHKWEDHIVKRHPEMKAYLEQVRITIEQPQLIQGSTRSTTTAYYYRLAGRGPKSTDYYVGVVVDRNEETRTGFVKTAHLLRNLRTDGGKILWLKH